MIDAKAILAEVQGNRARLEGCVRHSFTGGARIGEKKVCTRCGGQLGLVEVGQYIAGFRAAGGSAADIWPEYARTTTSPRDDDNGRTGE